MTSADYLHSPRRYLVRGAIIRRTRRTLQLVARIPCAMCYEHFFPEQLELHEFPGRGTVYDKASLDHWPVCLHALICRGCHEGHGQAHPNSYKGMRLLLRWNAMLWGRGVCKRQIWRYNRRYKPISSLHLDYTMLEEPYDNQDY